MKKIALFLSAATIAALSLVSCNKELEQAPDSQDFHEVSFEIGEPVSRTSITVDAESRKATVYWTDTPDSYVHLFENGTEGTDCGIKINSGNKKATLSGKFSGIITVGTFNYRAVIAANYADGVATVPDVQYPAATSYDPAADILIGTANTVYIRPHDLLQPSSVSGVSLYFGRANAFVRLEFSGLKSGEKVELIEVIGSNNFAGPLKPLKDFAYDGYDKENGSNKITLSYSDNNTVGADGKFVTYFCCWAVNPGAFTVNIATDKTRYTKSAPQATTERMAFNRDEITNIRMDMTGQEMPSRYYELVTGTPSSWGGTYLFVNKGESGAAKALNASSKSTGYASDVTVRDMGGSLIIASTDAVNGLAWDLSDSGKTDGGQKLWNVMTGTAALIFDTSKYLFNNNGTISVYDNNYTGIVISRKYFYHQFSALEPGVQMSQLYDSKKTYLGWNGSAFAYTNDSANKVYLYKLNDSERQSQTLSYPSEVVQWTIAEGKYQIGQTYDGQAFTASSKYQSDLLSFESSDPSVATVDASGRITIKKQGEVTITATAAANINYRGASASYLLRIYEPYYQRIHSASEITSGARYLLVSKTELLGDWYHAFCATNGTTYDFDINTLATLLDNPVYDNGEKIRPSSSLDANQVIIEKGIISVLTGGYTLKPVSVNKYLYCNTDITSYVSDQILIPTYGIAFAESSGANWLQSLEQIATAPHSITFDENSSVHISTALNKLGLGGTLLYSKLEGKYTYINLTLFDQFSNVADLVAYLGQNSEYATLLSWISTLSQNISISQLINYFAADLYLYKLVE